MSLLNIAISGLRTAQLAISAAGHNIANAHTPGFSRQRVETQTQPGTASGVGFLGQGVRAIDIARVVDEYTIRQVRDDVSVAGQHGVQLDNLSQIDDLLADERTGLGPGLSAFFAALNGASNDPASIPPRRLVLTQADALADRFHALYERAAHIDDATRSQLRIASERVSGIAAGIAEVNRAIELASARGAGSPNDLLDERDRLLEQLAEQVDVNVVLQDARANVFIGNGQPLVVGGQVNVLHANVDSGELRLRTQGGDINVSGALSGGRLGGLLSFRKESLAGVFNTLGRIALNVADVVNAQHAQGVDLGGARGGLFFGDINDARLMADRVQPLTATAPTALGVRIVDPTALTLSDYEFALAGPGAGTYAIRRLADGVEVARGALIGPFPQVIAFDGAELTVSDGALTPGDRLLLRPTHFAARDIARRLDDPTALALASPLAGTASAGNLGTGRVSATHVLDIEAPAFAQPGRLSPPIAIRFTSERTYDVLDATDPVQLRQLSPPLRGLPFVPGISNDLLPAAPGTGIVESLGARAGNVGASVVAAGSQLAATPPGNGYLADTLRVAITDPATGVVTPLPALAVAADASARTIAATLNGIDGVTARAHTEVRLHSLQDDATGEPLGILVDGIDVPLPGRAPGQRLDLGQVADAINAHAPLRSRGITARSDGLTLDLARSDGRDLTVGIRGDAADAITVEGQDGNVRVLRGAGSGSSAVLDATTNLAAGFDFTVGGPYTFALAVDGRVPASVTLTGTHASGSALTTSVQAAVDAAVGSGRVVVSLAPGGGLRLTSSSRGPLATLAVSAVSAGSGAAALGLANTQTRGDAPYEAVSVGGRIDVELAPDHSLSAALDNVFSANPVVQPAFLGYQVSVGGAPVAGDIFIIDHARDGVGDNRNGLEMAALELAPVLERRRATLADGYSELVQQVGGRTAAARIDADAAQALVAHSRGLRDDVAGVNLDEEAADLLRYEHAYTASSRVIGVARDLFDTLLRAFA